MADNDDEPDDPYAIKTPGTLTFFVIQSYESKEWDSWEFEFECLDYTGCVHWMLEGIGVDTFLTQIADPRDFKEGWTYTIHDINVKFTRGYTPDEDDEDWSWDEVVRSGNWLTWAWHKIGILWWRYRHG